MKFAYLPCLLGISACTPVGVAIDISPVGAAAIELQQDAPPVDDEARCPITGGPAVLAADMGEAPAGNEIHGRVIDARTGQGFGGCKVRIRQGDNQREMLTAADGSFSLASFQSAQAPMIWVSPRRGWRWLTAQSFYAVALSKKAATGEEAVLMRVAEFRSGPVSGIVVDEDTGTPVPNYRFRIVSAPYSSRKIVSFQLVSDAEGCFFTAGPVHGGTVTIVGEDPPVRLKQQLVIGESEKPWSVAVRVPHNIEVELSGSVPADPTQLSMSAHVVGTDRVEKGVPLVRREDGALGVSSWKSSLPDGIPVVLVVTDKQGLLLATRPHIWGEPYPVPLRFELIEMAALKIQYEAEPLPGEEEDVFGLRSLRYDTELTPQRGDISPLADFRLAARKWLPPGDYELTVTTRNHHSVRQRLKLAPGKITTTTCELARVKEAHTVHGTIRMESGAALADCDVFVSLPKKPGASWWVALKRGGWLCGNGLDHTASHEIRSGVEVGEFTIEHVPEGTLDIRIDCSLPTRHDLQRRVDGGLDLDVVLLDREEQPGFGFNVSAGRFCDLDYWARFRNADGTIDFRAGENGKVSEWGNPADREFEWAVYTWDRRPVYGTQADFVEVSEGRYFAKVALESGWGTCVVVTGKDGEPLSGAEVVLDGVRAGRTDKAGKLYVSAAVQPVIVNVVLDGWHSSGLPRQVRNLPWTEIELER